MTWTCPSCGTPLENGRRAKGAGYWRIWFECRRGRRVQVTKRGMYAYPSTMPTDCDLEDLCERVVKQVRAKDRKPLRAIKKRT